MACPERIENTKGDCTDRSWYPYICALTGAKIDSDKNRRRCEYSCDYKECRAYKEEYNR